MDDLYPGATIQYNQSLSSPVGLYVYGSVIIGILGTVGLFCTREPTRIYRTMKRKNTDESPIIQI